MWMHVIAAAAWSRCPKSCAAQPLGCHVTIQRVAHGHVLSIALRQTCLLRALDHAPGCPFCRTALSPVAAYAENRAIATLLRLGHADALEQRRREVEAAENASNSCLPIFVCMTVRLPASWVHTRAGSWGQARRRIMSVPDRRGVASCLFLFPLFAQSLPGTECPLHVFEPRYRLMMRRAMESGRRAFGMCAHVNAEGRPFSEFGVQMYIRNIEVRGCLRIQRVPGTHGPRPGSLHAKAHSALALADGTHPLLIARARPHW